MPIALSIIIPCFNKVAFTLNTISILSALNPKDTEIIIVDNASTDDTKKELQALTIPNLSRIFNSQNKFHSGGCNTGFAEANGERILFLNNDIKGSTTHDDIVKAIDSNPDGLTGPTGGFIDKDDQWGFKYETRDGVREYNYLSGWCIGARKETWEKLWDEDQFGPWNEEFPLYYNDGDLAFRAKQQDIPITIHPFPLLMHIGQVSTKQMNVQKLYTEARKKFNEKWASPTVFIDAQTMKEGR